MYMYATTSQESTAGSRRLAILGVFSRVGRAPAQLGAKCAGKSSQTLPKEAKLPIF